MFIPAEICDGLLLFKESVSVEGPRGEIKMWRSLGAIKMWRSPGAIKMWRGLGAIKMWRGLGGKQTMEGPRGNQTMEAPISNNTSKATTLLLFLFLIKSQNKNEIFMKLKAIFQ
jgi:hypothetical protein